MNGLPDNFDLSFLLGLELTVCHAMSNQTAFDFQRDTTSEWITVMGDYSFAAPGDREILFRKGDALFDPRLYSLMHRRVIAASVLGGADVQLEFEGGGTLVVHDVPHYESYVIRGHYV